MVKILIVWLALVNLSCSRPRYEQVAPLQPSMGSDGLSDNSDSSKKQTDCSLRFEKASYCIAWKWETLPTSKQSGTLILKTYRLNTYDKTAIYLDLPILPQLHLWMPSMAHGSVPTKTVRLDIGTYRFENVFFIMPGDWELRFQLDQEGSSSDVVTVSLTI